VLATHAGHCTPCRKPRHDKVRRGVTPSEVTKADAAVRCHHYRHQDSRPAARSSLPTRDHVTGAVQVLCQILLHLDGGLEGHRVRVLVQLRQQPDAVMSHNPRSQILQIPCAAPSGSPIWPFGTSSSRGLMRMRLLPVRSSTHSEVCLTVGIALPAPSSTIARLTEDLARPSSHWANGSRWASARWLSHDPSSNIRMLGRASAGQCLHRGEGSRAWKVLSSRFTASAAASQISSVQDLAHWKW